MTDEKSVKGNAQGGYADTSDPQQEGRTEELRQEFSIWSLASLLVCLMATWEALSSVVAQALINGGPPCLFYNYIISFLGTLCLAASMAEIASVYPTAGGQYHWVAALAPPDSKAFVSWVTGWISIGGQLVLTASAAFAAGLQLQALIVLNNPNYAGQRWQGMLFYWLILLYSMVINIWGSRALPTANMVSGVIHVLGFVVIVCVLGAMTEEKHSATYVFADVSNSSGWSSDGVSWLVGLLSAVYPFLGYDAAAHMAEELPEPSRAVPIAMMGSIIVNGIMGLIYCIILLFCVGDLTELLETPTGFPFIQLFLNSTNSYAAATVMTLIITFIAVAANAAGLTSTSRTAWAFARDDAFPFSRFFSHLGKRSHVPGRMCVLLTVLQMLLGLIYVGNATAFNAILAMAVIGMYASYLLPIIYMLIYGRNPKSPTRVKFAWFRLGKWGPAINVAAIMWGVLAVVFSVFPSYQPVTAANMNYSIAVFGAWVVGGCLYYLVRQRDRFQGPVMNWNGEADGRIKVTNQADSKSAAE